jgi:hypothetical protein
MWTASTRIIKRTVSLLKAPPSITHTHPVFSPCVLCVVDKIIIGYPFFHPPRIVTRYHLHVHILSLAAYLYAFSFSPRLVKCSSLPVCSALSSVAPCFGLVISRYIDIHHQNIALLQFTPVDGRRLAPGSPPQNTNYLRVRFGIVFHFLGWIFWAIGCGIFITFLFYFSFFSSSYCIYACGSSLFIAL